MGDSEVSNSAPVGRFHCRFPRWISAKNTVFSANQGRLWLPAAANALVLNACWLPFRLRSPYFTAFYLLTLVTDDWQNSHNKLDVTSEEICVSSSVWLGQGNLRDASQGSSEERATEPTQGLSFFPSSISGRMNERARWGHSIPISFVANDALVSAGVPNRY